MTSVPPKVGSLWAPGYVTQLKESDEIWRLFHLIDHSVGSFSLEGLWNGRKCSGTNTGFYHYSNMRALSDAEVREWEERRIMWAVIE